MVYLLELKLENLSNLKIFKFYSLCYTETNIVSPNSSPTKQEMWANKELQENEELSYFPFYYLKKRNGYFQINR